MHSRTDVEKTSEMPKILKYQKYEIYIYSESSGKHHLPHCHVHYSDGDIIVSLPSLEVIIGNESLSKVLKKYLISNLEVLCGAWDEFNPKEQKQSGEKSNEKVE